MCNFCEPYKHEDESIGVDLLCDFPGLNYMACIKGETPISKRRERLRVKEPRQYQFILHLTTLIFQ